MKYSEFPQNVEDMYNTAVKLCMSLRKFSKDDLCKGLVIDSDTCNTLIAALILRGVMNNEDDDGNFYINTNYNHSDYLLRAELNSQEEVKTKNIKIKNMQKYIGIAAFIIFCATIYFALRAPMSLLLIIPVCLLIGVASEKVGVIMASAGVVIVCAISLFWVHSKSPIWGDRYETRLRYEEIKKQEKQEKLDDSYRVMNAESAVRQSMKDPAAAKFKMSKLMPNGAVCGQVNGKNSLGAYTGYERFIYYSGIATIDDGSPSFSSTWNSNCN